MHYGIMDIIMVIENIYINIPLNKSISEFYSRTKRGEIYKENRSKSKRKGISKHTSHKPSDEISLKDMNFQRAVMQSITCVKLDLHIIIPPRRSQISSFSFPSFCYFI